MTYKPKKLILLGKTAEKILEYDFVKDVNYITFPHPSYYHRMGKDEEWKSKFVKVLHSEGERADSGLKDWFQ